MWTRRVPEYAAAKQEHVVELIEQGRFMAFPDALRFILAVKAGGTRVAAASSSKNARLFLERIRLDTFCAEQRLGYNFVHEGMTLEDLFDINISGRDFPAGKPDPMIFLTAAEELNLSPDVCFVIEDATSGVQAAKAGGMAAIGVARLGDQEQLEEAGADLVVTSLDDVSLRALGEGRLQERRAAGETRRRYAERPPSVWTLVYDGFDPARQGLRESLCSLGNGYFATRAALPEAEADGVHYPGTYVAGLYNRLVSQVGGRDVENEDLVNVPNWLPLRFRVDGGRWFDVSRADVEVHRLELDMRRGTLTRHLIWREPDGRRTSMVQHRFVSRNDEHLAGLATEFTAENWSGTLTVPAGLDGRVVNAGVARYRDLNGRHLAVLGQAQVDAETIDLQAETTQSRVRVAVAARTRLLRDGRVVEVDRTFVEEPGFVAQELTVGLEQGRPVTVEKIVALYTSRDRAISESRDDARLAATGAPDFAGLLTRHEGAWRSTWNRFDVELDSANEWTETVLHLHIFHLLQTVSPHTVHLDVGVPARGWNGEAYRGHIFWDELFIFPFFNFGRPMLAGPCSSTATPGSRWPGRRRGAKATPGRCSPGRAGRTGGRRPSRCTSTRSPGAGCPTTRTCSATSTSPSPTTCGSTTWSPGTCRSCASPVPSCWSRSPASGRPSRSTCRSGIATRSTASWVRTSTTRATRTPTSRACATTPTPTSWRSGC